MGEVETQRDIGRGQHAVILVVKHGGASKVPALRAAQSLDRVVVVDSDAPASGIDVDYLEVADVTAESVLDAVARAGLRPRACFTYVDPATPVAAEVAARLSLPTLEPATASLLKDKGALRDRLRELAIHTPRYQLVRSEDDLESAAAAVGFPCILKPTTAAYGLGVRRIESPDLLHREFRAATAELTSGSFARFFLRTGSARWLLEEYLHGPELSIEILGHPRQPFVLAVHEKTITERAGHFREDRFVTAPSLLTETQLARICQEAERLCRLLQFTRGVGDLEARWMNDNTLAIIELQTTPAGGLISAMTRRSHGIDLHALHARAHLQSEPITVSPSERIGACAMEVLHGERAGSFTITGADRARTSQGVFDLQVLANEGVIHEPHSEYLGFVCAEADDAQSAVSRLEEALTHIRINQAAHT